MEYINTVLLWADQLPAWLVAVTALISGSTAVTALTPTTSDDKIINTVLKVLNFLAGNIGKNTNSDS